MWCEVRKDPTNGGNLRSEPRSRLSTSPFGSLSLGVLVPSLVPRVSTRHLVPNRREKIPREGEFTLRTDP